MSVSVLMLIGRIALVICLYAFLALILVTLWRDVRASAAEEEKSPAMYSLHRLREDGTTERIFPLRKASCFIGRSPSVEVSLPDETVSITHARIWKESGQWWIEDLDSRNGTLLNQIPVGKRTVLCAGDKILAGRILLEFHSQESPPASANPGADPPAATDAPA